MDGTTLRSRVMEELRLEPGLETASIGVDVRGGVVTLQGSVPTPGASQLADRAAKRVAGVDCVIDSLSLAPARTGKDDGTRTGGER